MALTERTERRPRPVKLTDIPAAERLRAASKLASRSKDANEARALLAAAIHPSETVYYVTAA